MEDPKFVLTKLNGNKNYRILFVPPEFEFLNKKKLASVSTEIEQNTEESEEESSGEMKESKANKIYKDENEEDWRDVVGDSVFEYEEAEEIQDELKNEFEEKAESRTSLEMKVPSCLIKVLIGRKGNTKRSLEKELNVKIEVNDNKQKLFFVGGNQFDFLDNQENLGNSNEIEKEEQIVVLRCKETEKETEERAKSKKKSILLEAERRISAFLNAESEKIPYTHFIAIPLFCSNTAKSFNAFMASVLSENYEGIDKSVFIEYKKLHFTLLMLRLLSREKINKCVQIFEKLRTNIYAALDAQPLVVSLEGVYIMNDDPARVDVVFTTLAENNRKAPDSSCCAKSKIATVCGAFVTQLKNENLIDEKALSKQRLLDSSGKNIDLKLHATLMNTKYKYRHLAEKQQTNQKTNVSVNSAFQQKVSENTWKHREKMNVEKLLQKYKNYDFGQVKAERISLYEVGSTLNDGAYKTITEIILP